MNERPNKDRNPQRNMPQKPQNAPGKQPGGGGGGDIDKGNTGKGGWDEKNRPARKESPTTPQKQGGLDETSDTDVEQDDNE